MPLMEEPEKLGSHDEAQRRDGERLRLGPKQW
jgi:hypothetical protein